ncbi:hypothetical protein ASPBRDRAFT_220407 [Aspergillus brasiliensis CBS 101740]|uniref:AMP-dependent synthetase/ligase domain-containing protein n=1 Tax=Aspergillus brasiliensis (strain CBS 101740 / IMI 381727 / IBT 21946) TaxID=767769 RepID=A0A1L9UZ38_ASPBC|nr:hypothetical protein ASPBRDRAFT_220407 [Aspergillus brasiliensis CBS 101740]
MEIARTIQGEYQNWFSFAAEHLRECPHCTLAAMSGEAVPQKLLQRFCALDCPSVQLLNLYSSAGRALFGSTWQGLIEYRKSDLELPPAAGYASPNQAIYTVNSELRPLPVGVPGEILIGGASVAAGDGKMDTTTETFIKSFILRLNSNLAAENWTTV